MTADIELMRILSVQTMYFQRKLVILKNFKHSKQRVIETKDPKVDVR